MSLALLLVSCCVYAKNNVTVVSGEEFEKYGDRIISEKLFGSYDLSETIRIYCSKDGITKIYYFYEMNNDIICLAYVKRDASSPQNVYILLNTTYQTGRKCMVLYGQTLFNQENPILYFGKETKRLPNPIPLNKFHTRLTGFRIRLEFCKIFGSWKL